MELLGLDVLLPRYLFVFLGWLIFFLMRIWTVKNAIEDLESTAKRKKAWKEHRRKHIEDYPIALLVGLILSTVLNAVVIIYDAAKGSDYNHVINGVYADLGVSFIIGLKALNIAKRIRGKADEDIENLLS